MITVHEEIADKKRFMKLLLLGDEQESMVLKYLSRGKLFVMNDGSKAVAVCVVTDEGNGTLEIKNIAVSPESQRLGYGRKMISFIKKQILRFFSSAHCRNRRQSTYCAFL